MLSSTAVWDPPLTAPCPVTSSHLLGHSGDSSLLGTFPAAVLDPLIEHLLELVAATPELEGMQRSLRNAYGLYLKTRPAASSESVRRAKALQAEGPHPLLLAQIPEGKYSSLQVRRGKMGGRRPYCACCFLRAGLRALGY